MAAKTPSESTSGHTGEGSMPLTHNVPPTLSFEKSKLDWLLAINEQYFEAELKTVVSNSSHFLLLHLILPIELLLLPCNYF